MRTVVAEGTMARQKIREHACRITGRFGTKPTACVLHQVKITHGRTRAVREDMGPRVTSIFLDLVASPAVLTQPVLSLIQSAHLHQLSGDGFPQI
jgi:hypothetical protein